MVDMLMKGSGIYSYWFSTKDEVVAYCSTCEADISSYDVCRDDDGDYSIQCNWCEDYVQVWKDGEDE